MVPEPESRPGTARRSTAGTDLAPYVSPRSGPHASAPERQPSPLPLRPPTAADSAPPDRLVMMTALRTRCVAVREGVLLPLCRLLGRQAATVAARVAQLARYLRRARGKVVSQRLESHVRAVPQARRIIRTELARWGLAEHVEIAELLVSELVTNAVQHAWGPLQLRMSHSPVDRTLRCDVADGCPAAPPADRPPARADEDHGRGLHLVDQLSTRWGARHTAAGKTVWFELRTPGRARRRGDLRRRI
ncbi:ATP-binding protein [Streptomyces sioyaensis]|uniref:ATP-binding protein n=2 Tax=Streptomyces sioyaensis TaxID=67364 RepID=A0A4V1NR83_9ACTN|nr:ATP-binding protein [Streptomyces sioyaensis]